MSLRQLFCFVSNYCRYYNQLNTICLKNLQLFCHSLFSEWMIRLLHLSGMRHVFWYENCHFHLSFEVKMNYNQAVISRSLNFTEGKSSD